MDLQSTSSTLFQPPFCSREHIEIEKGDIFINFSLNSIDFQ